MSDWESYWKQISATGDDGQVFWDSDNENPIRLDLERFRPFFDPRLPLLDLGCGNGRQARFFARHFDRVIGVDISESAVALAQRETGPESGVIFRVLNALDSEAVQALQAEFGDMNVYMRGVLHQIKRKDRFRVVKNLAILLGGRGTLYQIELTGQSILKFRLLPENVFAKIPKITRRIGFEMEDRAIFYPDEGWIVLDQSDSADIRTIPLQGRKGSVMPATYFVLRRRS